MINLIFPTGILQKGDGALFTSDNFPMNLTRWVGDGSKRRSMTSTVSAGGSGGPLQSNLMRVVSMTAGPDGSLYIGDYNLVRKVSPDGTSIQTILQLK